jgi:hypothetical protein
MNDQVLSWATLIEIGGEIAGGSALVGQCAPDVPVRGWMWWRCAESSSLGEAPTLVGCHWEHGNACGAATAAPNASVDIPSAQAQLTIIRAATDLFLSRHSLTLRVEGAGGCSSSTELFPNTGYVSRRNLYQAGAGLLYMVGQFDARVIDPLHCTITLAEFRTLDRYVTFRQP